MSRKTIGNVLVVFSLVTIALSGCQSSKARLPFASWMHRRDAAFAYAPPTVPPSATSADSISQGPSNDTKPASQASAANQSAVDPYAAGADATMASRGSFSASGSERRPACTSGCCSR